MIKVLKILSIFSIIFVGLHAYSHFFGYQPTKRDIIEKSLIDKFIIKVENLHGVKLVGIGGGEDDGIWLYTFYFDYFKPIDKRTARLLILDISNVFLSLVNENEEIRPYLKNYPFDTKNIYIAVISYASNKREYTYEPYIGVVSIGERGIAYKTNDPDNLYQYKSDTEETYEQALEIVHQQNLREEQKN